MVGWILSRFRDFLMSLLMILQCGLPILVEGVGKLGAGVQPCCSTPLFTKSWIHHMVGAFQFCELEQVDRAALIFFFPIGLASGKGVLDIPRENN